MKPTLTILIIFGSGENLRGEERLEHVGEVLRRDPAPVVGDLEHDALGRPSRRSRRARGGPPTASPRSRSSRARARSAGPGPRRRRSSGRPARPRAEIATLWRSAWCRTSSTQRSRRGRRSSSANREPEARLKASRLRTMPPQRTASVSTSSSARAVSASAGEAVRPLPELLAEQPRVGGDPGQRVVDLVGDDGGELAERRHLLHEEHALVRLSSSVVVSSTRVSSVRFQPSSSDARVLELGHHVVPRPGEVADLVVGGDRGAHGEVAPARLDDRALEPADRAEHQPPDEERREGEHRRDRGEDARAHLEQRRLDLRVHRRRARAARRGPRARACRARGRGTPRSSSPGRCGSGRSPRGRATRRRSRRRASGRCGPAARAAGRRGGRPCTARRPCPRACPPRPASC